MPLLWLHPAVYVCHRSRGQLRSAFPDEVHIPLHSQKRIAKDSRARHCPTLFGLDLRSKLTFTIVGDFGKAAISAVTLAFGLLSLVFFLSTANLLLILGSPSYLPDHFSTGTPCPPFPKPRNSYHLNQEKQLSAGLL